MTFRIARGEELDSINRATTAATSWLPSPPVLDGQRTVVEQVLEVAAAHGLTEPPDLADFVVDFFPRPPFPFPDMMSFGLVKRGQVVSLICWVC